MSQSQPSPAEDSVSRLHFNQSHAFIIGINAYEKLSPLSTAVNDATVLARKLQEDHGYRVHGPLLDANRWDILQLLEQDMPAIVQPEDRVLFYFAGHGIALHSDDNPQGYLIPADADPKTEDSLVAMDVLHAALEQLPCNHGLLIMDCCFAGSFKWSTGFRDAAFDLPGIIYEERFYQYARDPAWQVITSSAADQKAVDILHDRTLGLRSAAGAEHSPFARALIEGLDGAADTVPKGEGDGVITATELYTYLRDRVEDETTAQETRQSPAIFSLKRHDKGQYIFLQPNHRLNLPPIPKRNPFMGLKSYDEVDHHLFYGRDRVIEALEKRVGQNPLLVVSGASGTGKSSVLKAGLLPLLRERDWRILPVVRPGKEPLLSLDKIREDLAAAVRQSTPVVLLVDQYEELVTQCMHPAGQVAFEQQLAEWLRAYAQLKILISVRSDFEPQFQEGPLAQWWKAGWYAVPSFSSDELREVIIKPTAQEVLFFEPHTLVDTLVDAVNQAPGALPLLSFTLSELYHAYINGGRTDRAFIEQDYQKLGGVIGALSTRADRLYADYGQRPGVGTDYQRSMRRLLFRLTSLDGGEPAGRRIFADDLAFSDAAETERMTTVAADLVTARLVSTGVDDAGQTYYEPAHDALVRSWTQLRRWIHTFGEERLLRYSKLNQAVDEYRSKPTPKVARQYLWDEHPELSVFQSELAQPDHSFNAREEDFIRKSIAARRRSRRRVLAIAASVLFVIALLGFAIKSQIDQNGVQKELTEQQKELTRQQELLTDEQRRRAAEESAARGVADSLRKKADEFAGETQAAREALAAANSSFVNQLLQAADRALDNGAYDEAFANLDAASQFGLAARAARAAHELPVDWDDRARNGYREIAFFYVESNQSRRLLGELDRLFKIEKPPAALADLAVFYNRDGSLDSMIDVSLQIADRIGDRQIRKIVGQQTKAARERATRERAEFAELLQIEPILRRTRNQRYAGIDAVAKQRIYDSLSVLIIPHTLDLERQALQELLDSDLNRLQARYLADHNLLTLNSGVRFFTQPVNGFAYSLFLTATGGQANITKVPATEPVRVTWTEAARYANWLSRQRGLDTFYVFRGNRVVRVEDGLVDAYRLPSVSEVEVYSGSGGQFEQTWCQDTIQRGWPFLALTKGRIQVANPQNRNPFHLIRGENVVTDRESVADAALPLSLYFDFDRPSPRQYRFGAEFDYFSLAEEYLTKQGSYVGQMTDRLQADVVAEARERWDRFFAEDIPQSVVGLQQLGGQIADWIRQGKRVEIVVDTPPAYEDYSRRLYQARGESIRQALTKILPDQDQKIENRIVIVSVQQQSGINNLREDGQLFNTSAESQIMRAKARQAEVLAVLISDP